MDMIGKMYRTIVVLTNTPNTTSGGGSTDNYSTLLTTRAAIEPRGGARTVSFSEILGNDSYTITTRYQAALWSAITMSMKFVSEGLTYTLQSYDRKNDKRKEYIVFNVTLQRNG